MVVEKGGKDRWKDGERKEGRRKRWMDRWKDGGREERLEKEGGREGGGKEGMEVRRKKNVNK